MGSAVYNVLSSALGTRLLTNEPMHRHTSWQIGGGAQYLIEPQTLSEIKLGLKLAADLELPVTIIGNGTNLLVKDTGIPGLVIKIARGFNAISIVGTNITVGAGAMLPKLAQQAMKNNLAGLAWCAGIPGSIGGALIMNAGAHGSALGDTVISARVMDLDGTIIAMDRQQMTLGYRTSIFQHHDLVVLEATFGLRAGDGQKIKKEMDQYLAQRKSTQPRGYPNAGSVFKNPPGASAGKLIELAGGKGLRLGNAQVSTVHANWIVNLGGATAQDVLGLIEKIKAKVKQEFDLSLQLEVRVLG